MSNFDDLNELSGLSLDEIPDLEGFTIFPKGLYVMDCTFSSYKKDASKKPAVKLQMTVVEVQEIAEDAKAPKVGAKTNVFYHLWKKDGAKNEIGLGKLKLALQPIAVATGSTDLTAALAAAQDIRCLVELTHRKNKESGEMDIDVASVTPL